MEAVHRSRTLYAEAVCKDMFSVTKNEVQGTRTLNLVLPCEKIGETRATIAPTPRGNRGFNLILINITKSNF